MYTLPDAADNVLLDSPTPCALNMAAQFLADPTQAPDSSCIAGTEARLCPACDAVGRDDVHRTHSHHRGYGCDPTPFTDPQGTGSRSDPADPINIPTGLVRFAIVVADTADAAVATLTDSTVIAEDQAIRRLSLEDRGEQHDDERRHCPWRCDRIAHGKHYLTILLGGPEHNYAAVVATIWEPILSSVKVE